MIIATIRQEFTGILNLSIPIIFASYFYPQYLCTVWGILLCSLIIGAYLAYLSYKATSATKNSLLFEPTGAQKKLFEADIIRCGLKSEDVALRYAYTDDAIALTMFNTIALDPMLWSGIDDPEFIKAHDVVAQHVLPGVPENKKQFHAKIKKILSQDAQKFIFRHELAHVFHNFSNKRIALNGLIGFIFTSSALTAAYAMLPSLGGWLALVVGIIVAACVDLSLTYASNYFFKSVAEKNADLFAVQFSSKEEIQAAADFFSGYELAAQEYRKTIGLATTLPVFITGYIDGISRAKYLREMVRS